MITEGKIEAVSSCSNIPDTGIVVVVVVVAAPHSTQPQASFSSLLAHTVTSSCPSVSTRPPLFPTFTISGPVMTGKNRPLPLWLLARISHKVIILFVVPVNSSATTHPGPKIHTIAEL